MSDFFDAVANDPEIYHTGKKLGHTISKFINKGGKYFSLVFNTDTKGGSGEHWFVMMFIFDGK